MLETFKVRTLW